MDSGLGSADFLDELIPVDEWAMGGQSNTRRQQQIEDAEVATNGAAQARNDQQPQGTTGA
jgi:hypothetical protein